jgi:hypothetical protein
MASRSDLRWEDLFGTPSECCVDQSIIVAMAVDDDVEEEFGRIAGAGV